MIKQRRASLTLLALFASLAAAAALSACGFQLRGSNGGTNLPFETIYINLGETSPLGAELKRYIRGSSDTKIADDAKKAEAIFDVLAETRGETILSLNAQGRIRELELYYTLQFRVRGQNNAILMQPTTITLKRDMSFNEAVVLAKDAEKALLYRDMQSDLVQQIMRRLAALKPQAQAKPAS